MRWNVRISHSDSGGGAKSSMSNGYQSACSFAVLFVLACGGIAFEHLRFDLRMVAEAMRSHRLPKMTGRGGEERGLS
jgi:hypothetical protein